jgi:hypothetical protein
MYGLKPFRIRLRFEYGLIRIFTVLFLKKLGIQSLPLYMFKLQRTDYFHCTVLSMSDSLPLIL